MQDLTLLSDDALLENTRACARYEREKTALLVASLAEVYRRDLALKRGYSSIYRYAREELGLSDSMAWERVSAARLSLEMPETVGKISRGELTLSAASDLYKTIGQVEKPKKVVAVPVQQTELMPSAPALPPPASLTLEEKRSLLTEVSGKTRDESAQVLQSFKDERLGQVPRPKLHERTFTLTDEELAQFDRLRDLLSHQLGTRDPQAVFLWLMKTGLAKVDPVLKEACQRQRSKKSDALFLGGPSTPAQTVPRERKPLPAALKRRVWIRDQGRCQYTDPVTRRQCEAASFLDYDHLRPLSEGGGDDEGNLRLCCQSHNRRRYGWAS